MVCLARLIRENMAGFLSTYFFVNLIHFFFLFEIIYIFVSFIVSELTTVHPRLARESGTGNLLICFIVLSASYIHCLNIHSYE